VDDITIAPRDEKLLFAAVPAFVNQEAAGKIHLRSRLSESMTACGLAASTVYPRNGQLINGAPLQVTCDACREENLDGCVDAERVAMQAALVNATSQLVKAEETIASMQGEMRKIEEQLALARAEAADARFAPEQVSGVTRAEQQPFTVVYCDEGMAFYGLAGNYLGILLPAPGLDPEPDEIPF
jgi:hypothetical protein